MASKGVFTYRHNHGYWKNNLISHWVFKFLGAIRCALTQTATEIGGPYNLWRNLEAPRLCNGTRLRVTQLRQNIIDATILTGVKTGQNVFILRVPIIPTDLPFQFKRLQFPVKLSFAMTVNKAQGQTLQVAGVNLKKPCFFHDQLPSSILEYPRPKICTFGLQMEKPLKSFIVAC